MFALLKVRENNTKAVIAEEKAAAEKAARDHHAEAMAKLAALDKTQAVIEFEMDGTILSANANFLGLMGYTLSEIAGRHHSMFVEPGFRDSEDYRSFWRALGRGEHHVAQFKRITRNGQAVWIEASYNPLLDDAGKPCKVVKFATDVTRQVELLAELQRLIDENFSEVDQALSSSTGHAAATSDAVDRTRDNIQSVASSTEELAASIREIAATMAKSRAATDTAHAQTRDADQATQRLAYAAKSMSSIVGLIQNIASQINLLALNATIESARAGAAGKGFAVVASEIKNLARAAADATDQISAEIDSVRSVSDEVVAALGEIGASIETVREFVAGTASAVEEQSAVTQDVSHTMQTAVGNVSTIATSSGEMSAAIMQVVRTVDRAKAAASGLAR